MINLSLCTISFRHQLMSIEQVADWARAQQFHGIELWGIHARNLAHQPEYCTCIRRTTAEPRCDRQVFLQRDRHTIRPRQRRQPVRPQV